MIKVNGAEWKRFFADPKVWDGGAWIDDELILIDGVEATGDVDLSAVPDGAEIRVDGGTYYPTDSMRDWQSLISVIRAWRKRQNTVTLIVEAPREAEGRVRDAVAVAGGRVR